MSYKSVILGAFAFLVLIVLIIYIGLHYVVPSHPQINKSTTTTTSILSCPSCLNDAQIKALDIKAGHLQQQLDLLTIKYTALNKSVDVYRRMITFMRNASLQGIALANITMKLLSNVSWNKTDYKKFKTINLTAQAMHDKFLYISTR
jgi:hypothetical protein